MATIYTQADKNIRKTWIYMSFFLALILFIGYVVSYYFNDFIFFWIAFFYSLISSFVSYWYSDRIVLSLTKARPVKEETERELYHIVENLAITAGLPMPKVYILEEMQPNAFATGRNPEHGVVVVTRGLLQRLEKTELQGVIAHEMAHIGNRDALLQTAVVVLVGTAVMISNLFLRTRRFGKRDSGNKGGDILMIIGFIFIILSPIIASLIKMAISRKREFLADASGALLTRYPEGLALALEKISQDQTPLLVANNSISHLFITNPFKGNSISRLFSTHPPIEERVKALRSINI